MTLKSRIIAQFRHPSGLLGRLAGHIMASRRSNIIRNEKTVELLGLGPESRILEIGCGPGLALAACARVIVSGRMVGLDHSEEMIRQAQKRLRREGAADRVEFVRGGLDELCDWPETFDRAFSLNVIQFLDDKTTFYQRIFAVLTPKGRCLTTYQPRLAKDAGRESRRMVQDIKDALTAAGFVKIETVRILEGEAPAVCVLAERP